MLLHQSRQAISYATQKGFLPIALAMANKQIQPEKLVKTESSSSEGEGEAEEDEEEEEDGGSSSEHGDSTEAHDSQDQDVAMREI